MSGLHLTAKKGFVMEVLNSLSLGQILEKGAQPVPDKIAVVDGEQQKTYSELSTMTNALAVSLAKIGFKKFGQGGLVELAKKDQNREQIR